MAELGDDQLVVGDEPVLRPTRTVEGRVDAVVAAALPTLLFAGAIAYLYASGGDDRITALFYDEPNRVWPWQGHWLTKVVLHDWASTAITYSAAGSLLLGLLACICRSMVAWRRPAFFLFVSIAGSAGVVGLLKSFSPDPSPWNSTQFGGSIVHSTFFASVSPTGELGKNSPGAFASGGFALMAMYYIWRRRNRRLAWIWLIAGAVIGNLFGVVQVVRGAHYPSHNFWAALIVWVFITALYWGPFRGRAEHESALNQS